MRSKRRRFLQALASVGTAGVVGCSGTDGGRDGAGTSTEGPITVPSTETDRPTDEATERRTDDEASTPTEDEGEERAEDDDGEAETWSGEDAEAVRASAGEWPMARADAVNSGWQPVDAGPDEDATEAWAVSRYGSISPPTVADGTVYVGVAPASHGPDHGVYALDATTGDERWNVDGGWVTGAPAVVDGTVYAVFDGDLLAVSAETGVAEWRLEPDDSLRTAPTVIEDTVYVGSGDDSVYAVDAASGERRWRAGIGELRQGTPPDPIAPPAALGETLYVGVAGTVLALDATSGDERWRADVDSRATAAPTVADGTVYAAAGRSDGALYALEAATGDVRWQFDTARESPVSPAVADGTVYTVGGGGAVHALDANGGEKRWSLRLEGEFVAPPIVADGIAYVGDEGTGSADGALYALEAETGGERERFDVGDVHGIAVADGAAYVTGRSSVAALVDPDE